MSKSPFKVIAPLAAAAYYGYTRYEESQAKAARAESKAQLDAMITEAEANNEDP